MRAFFEKPTPERNKAQQPTGLNLASFETARPIIPDARGNTPSKVQRKAIGSPADAREQEADHVSEEVRRPAERKLATTCPCGGGCPNCRAGSESPRIQPKRSEKINETEIDTPESVEAVLKQTGSPLDAVTRSRFEPRFNFDFSRVRLHNDSLAARSAKAVGALAFTVGNDIVFGSGQYAPGSGEGQRLIAHELAHVVQQSQLTDSPNGSGLLIHRQTDGSADAGRPVEAASAPDASLSSAYIGYACEALTNIRRGVEEGRAWAFEDVGRLRADAGLLQARQQALQELVRTLGGMIEDLDSGALVPTEPGTAYSMTVLWSSRNADLNRASVGWGTQYPPEIVPREFLEELPPEERLSPAQFDLGTYTLPAESAPPGWASETSVAAGWVPSTDVFPRASLPTWWVIPCHSRHRSGETPEEPSIESTRATAGDLRLLDSVIYLTGLDRWDFEARSERTHPAALGTIYDWQQDDAGDIFIVVNGQRRYLLRNGRLEPARDAD